jgi:hypothetical protein
MTIETTIHRVVEFQINEVERYPEDSRTKEFFMRELVVLTDDGSKFVIKMFADKCKSLVSDR